jgi:hypothetical protein
MRFSRAWRTLGSEEKEPHMVKTGFYPFFTNEDFLLIGLIGLALVLKNWWDLIRYGWQRAITAAAPPASLGRPARLPRALRALRSMRVRRRPVARPFRPAHRPIGHGA